MSATRGLLYKLRCSRANLTLSSKSSTTRAFNASICLLIQSLVNLELLQGDAQAISLVKSRCKVIEAKKPSAIKGYCKKVNVFKFFHYKRYFVLDPDSGTLTRYKTESDYPITPVETIALTSILSVGYPQIQWYMKSDHHYLSVSALPFRLDYVQEG